MSAFDDKTSAANAATHARRRHGANFFQQIYRFFDVQPLALQFLDKNVRNIQPQDSEVALRIKM